MPKRGAAVAVDSKKAKKVVDPTPVAKKAKKAEPAPEPVVEEEDDDSEEAEGEEDEGEEEEGEEEEGEEEEEEEEEEEGEAVKCETAESEEGEEEDGEEEEEEEAAAEEEEEGAYKDYNIDCKDCNKPFVFTVGDQVCPGPSAPRAGRWSPPGTRGLAGVFCREGLRPEDPLQGVHRRQKGALQRGQGRRQGQGQG